MPCAFRVHPCEPELLPLTAWEAQSRSEMGLLQLSIESLELFLFCVFFFFLVAVIGWFLFFCFFFLEKH